MKKFFTLIAVAFVALSVNAEKYSIGVPNNNVGDGWFDAATKTVHFLEANSYRPGWWLAWNNETQSNSGQDFSKFDRFVIELSGIPAGKTVACLFEYVDESIAAQWVAADAEGKIVVTLDENGKKAVKQTYLQATVDEADVASFVAFDVTFVDAYFENDAEAATSVNLYEGNPSIPLDWDDGKVTASISTDALPLLKAGNYLGVDYTCEPYETDENSRYYQVQFMGSWWTLLEGAIGTNGAEKVSEGGNTNIIVTLEPTSTNVEFQLIDSDITTLNQQKAVLLAGHGIYVKRVYISETSQATTGINDVQVKKSENNAIYNLAGQKVSAQYKGVVIKNGKKVMQ